MFVICCVFFFSSRRRHTRCGRDWSSDVCSSDLRVRGMRSYFTRKPVSIVRSYDLQPRSKVRRPPLHQVWRLLHLRSGRGGRSRSRSRDARHMDLAEGQVLRARVRRLQKALPPGTPGGESYRGGEAGEKRPPFSKARAFSRPLTRLWSCCTSAESST